MGADSSFSAIDASNLVLREGKMEILMNAILYGRNMIVNVRKFVEFELTINMSIMLIIIITSILNKEPPFSYFQLMIINLLMDTFSAYMLTYQNPREGVNKLIFEINKDDPIVSSIMWIKIVLHSILISGISLFIF